MERTVLSKQISEILDALVRLGGGVYSMDLTDLQRYPENYEALSTDAALRAEKVVCRLRHLLFAGL